LAGNDVVVTDSAVRDVGASRKSHVGFHRPALPEVIALGALLVAHIAVQLATRPYPRWGDAILTFVYARDFPNVPADQHSTRLGIVLPARLFIDIFGFGEVAYYIYPAIMGVVLVVAMFLVGRRLFGLVGGAVAGYLIVFNPIIVHTANNTTSWQLLPDVPAVAWFTSGMALLLAVAHGSTGVPIPPSRSATAKLLAAGLCFGLAYECRELVAFMFVLLPLVTVLYRMSWRRLALVLAPMALILAAELAIAWIVWGDPLSRLHIAGEHGSPSAPVSRYVTLMKMPRALFHEERGSVSLLMLAVTVVAALVLWRRGLIIAAVWVLSLFLPLLLLGGFLDPSFRSLRLQLVRYWVPILPALVLGTVGTAHEILRLVSAHPDWPGRWLRWRVVAVVLLVLAWYPIPVMRYVVGNPNDRAWSDLRGYLEEHERELPVVSTGYRSAQTLLMYTYAPIGGELVWDGKINVLAELNEQGRLRKFGPVPQPGDIPEGALLYTMETTSPPPQAGDGWSLVFRSGRIRLYVPPDVAPGLTD
jgi:hypothetical protein